MQELCLFFVTLYGLDSSTLSLRFVLSRVFLFLYSLGPRYYGQIEDQTQLQESIDPSIHPLTDMAILSR